MYWILGHKTKIIKFETPFDTNYCTHNSLKNLHFFNKTLTAWCKTIEKKFEKGENLGINYRKSSSSTDQDPIKYLRENDLPTDEDHKLNITENFIRRVKNNQDIINDSETSANYIADDSNGEISDESSIISKTSDIDKIYRQYYEISDISQERVDMLFVGTNWKFSIFKNRLHLAGLFERGIRRLFYKSIPFSPVIFYIDFFSIFCYGNCVGVKTSLIKNKDVYDFNMFFLIYDSLCQ